MAKIFECDLDYLCAEGWILGLATDDRNYGSSTAYVHHQEHHPSWVRLRLTPCSNDSLVDDEEGGEGFVGPSGPHPTATDTLLDLLALDERAWER